MTCLRDGCFGECDTHSPKGETMWFLKTPSQSTFFYNFKQPYKALDGSGLKPKDFDFSLDPFPVQSILTALSVATKKYLAYQNIPFPVNFQDGWYLDLETDKVNGFLYTAPWIFESVDECKATYKPYYLAAPMYIYKTDLVVSADMPSMIFELLSVKIAGALKQLALAVEEKLATVNPPDGLDKIYNGPVLGGVEVHVPKPMKHYKVSGWIK